MTEKMYDLREGYVPSYLQGQPTQPIVAPCGAAVAPEPCSRVAMVVGQPEWASKPSRKGKPPKYPFDTLPVNGTFQVSPGPGQPTWYSFRTYCARKSADLGKKFRCHRYPDGTFEVWRES